ncbi:MAG: hypothetical protein ACAI38_18395 [Myxococcota bacterium]
MLGSRVIQPSSFNATESAETQATFTQLRRAAALTGSRYVKSSEPEAAARGGLDGWAAGLARASRLSVLEYTTLLYAARNSTLSDEKGALETLRRAWTQLTCLPAPTNILERRLPMYVLAAASRDERLFHVAVFRKDDEAPSRIRGLRDFVPSYRQLAMAAGVAGACFVLPAVGAALAGAASTVVISAVAEQLMHDLVGHATPATMKKLERFPRIHAYVEGARYAHAVVHHGMTFKDYVNQFRDEEHQAQVDAIIKKHRGEKHWEYIKKNGYGTSMGLRAAIQYVAPLTPFLVGAAALSGFNPAFMVGMLPALIAYPMYSAAVHDFLHKQMEKVEVRGGPLMRMYLATAPARLTSRQHWDHHRGSHRNMNLTPSAIGDLVLGSFVSLSLPKLLEVRRLEIVR